jgi:hypothetical protein
MSLQNELKDMKQIGRLAIRGEGEFVNAYYALPDTMDKALLLGSMHRSLLEASPELFEDWKKMMWAVVAMLIEDIAGVAPGAPNETPAPEHERAGRG